jgi:pimeloyl-ACP methyl ester carboxylesterase
MSAFWSQEYWAHKGDVKLYVYRKRASAPVAGETAPPVLFLVHGSSFSARSGFDLQVSGKPGYSLMETFAGYGFDVWTMDHEGYGKSGRTDGNSPIAEGVRDLAAAMEIVERETGRTRHAFYGSSSGALRAAAFAEAHPDNAAKLVLDAFVWTGEGSPTLAERRKKLDQWRASNMRPVDRAFFHSIFNRDKPGTSEEGIADALADAELPICTEVPTGTYLDMCANLPVCDPEKIRCPVLIVRGEHDGIATEEDLLAYYARLPVSDKQFIVIPGQAHVSFLGRNRARFLHVVRNFLEMPDRLDG